MFIPAIRTSPYRLFPTALLLPFLLTACGSPTTPPPAGSGTVVGPTCTSTGVSKGPWALRIDETSAVVRWEACRAETKPTLLLTPETGGAEREFTSAVKSYEILVTNTAPLNPDAPPDEAGTYYLHEVALTDLAPGICYSYYLGADAERKGRVCTSRPSGDPLTFLAIGDTNPSFNGITPLLLEQVLPKNPDFTIHAGDIQYYDSGLETWASWFPDMAPLLSQGAMLPAVGNHELEKPEELDAYYKRFFGDAGFDGEDTHYRFQSAGVWFFSIDTELPVDIGSKQGIWLAKSLTDAASRPGFRFSVVYFHKPFVTCGDKSENTSARGQLEPIFLQNGVRLVVQAHMHGYERFDFGNITYLTTGGGGGSLDDINKNIDRPSCASRVASGAFRHAVVFDVGPNGLDGTVIDEKGAIRDMFTLGP